MGTRGLDRSSEPGGVVHGDQTRGGEVPPAGSSQGGPDRKKLLAKRIGQLHMSYLEIHKICAQSELEDNKVRIAHMLAEKQRAVSWPQRGIQSTAMLAAQGPSGGGGDASGAAKNAKGKTQEQRIKVQSSLQGTLVAQAIQIPNHERVPSYKSWSYLMENELANEVGVRIFYTDPTGETIPASDSEDEDRKGEGNLEGAHREREEWVMRQLAAEHGVVPETVEALADRLDAAPSVVEARLKSLLEEKQQTDSQTGAVLSMMSGVEKCAYNFCRRCRIYNCLAHISGQDVRPHQRPSPSVSATGVPCGPDCWRVAQTAAGQARLSSCQTAASPSGQQQHLGGQHAQNGNPHKSASMASPVLGSGTVRDSLLGTPPRPRQIRSPVPLHIVLGASSTGDGILEGATHAARNGWEGTSCLASGSNWSAFEVDAVQYGMHIYAGDACRTARLVFPRKCWEVHALMRELPVLPLSAPCSPSLGPAKRAGSKRKPAAPQRRKNASQVVSKRAKHDMTKPWPRYTPCTCTGPCNAECSCAKSKNFCEKFCACGPSCSIRFVGCDCKSGCRTKACPCYAAGHECDPDLCNACTMSCVCNNMRLRFRQHKRVSMGKSEVSGWGSFLLEAAKKGELVGEYTGELVSQKEADRRGKAYDRDDNSYLFNLNEEWVIDARCRGNKLRFANHSTDPNCAAKILMVDGDHRVGIFACKDIAPGTELFYDYCYSKDQAPKWALGVDNAKA
ncbi:Histone-lysine N-methyltransferase EZH1 [Coccomyxa sp. Obi]|nr:Histone-lysine N-methyltransferase EZH1 [Coccomyxa sp. Obi]